MSDVQERRTRAINGARVYGVVMDEATALRTHPRSGEPPATQPCQGDHHAAIVAALTTKENRDG